MGRGKIPIKKIENKTNRQVTFSKRRAGLFKKAKELSVLCDAQISLIISNSNGRFYDFVNPNTTHKMVFDKYQRAKGIDLWHTHYEKMQEELRKLRDTNQKLQTAIRQRMGKDLEDMNCKQLFLLELTMTKALDTVFKQKREDIRKKKNTCTKKKNNMGKWNPGLKYEEFVEGEYPMDGWLQCQYYNPTYPLHQVHFHPNNSTSDPLSYSHFAHY